MKKIKTSLKFLDTNTTIIQRYYQQVVCEDLLLKQSFNKILELVKLKKITINASSKLVVKDKKYIIPSLLSLELITGQKSQLKGAKKSIATFKIREKQLIGSKSTLRKKKLFIFFDKVTKIIFPRLREFHGFSKKSFDVNGNYSMGIRNLLFFNELENFFEFFDFLAGIDITFSSTATNKNQSCLFFSAFQLPISY
jgi:large subunit ribosomal protein L5